MKMRIMALIIGGLFLLPVTAQEEGFTVSGIIENSKTGDIYIYLTDEDSSKKPFTGIQKLRLPVDDSSNREFISFSFDPVPPGEYGLRCFQDQNGNGKLDRGLFGPREPWGLSWNETRTSEWPSFRNYNFIVDSDRDDIRIVLEDKK